MSTGTGVYGVAQRARLEALQDRIAANIPRAAEIAALYADRFRTELPDLDDLTIGRVLVVLGVELGPLWLAADATTLWALFTETGLQLTEPEWHEITSEGPPA